MTLRRKLGDPPVVDTVVGAGYRVAPDPTAADPAAPPAGSSDGPSDGSAEAG
jgi:hypothetical protein